MIEVQIFDGEGGRRKERWGMRGEGGGRRDERWGMGEERGERRGGGGGSGVAG
jgi:hypothetical protein